MSVIVFDLLFIFNPLANVPFEYSLVDYSRATKRIKSFTHVGSSILLENGLATKQRCPKRFLVMLSDKFEPVSVCYETPEPMRNKAAATRRERRIVGV